MIDNIPGDNLGLLRAKYKDYMRAVTNRRYKYQSTTAKTCSN